MSARRVRSSEAPIDVKAMRQRMGLSQTDLVEKIYGNRNRSYKRTIRAWERKEQAPGPMARGHLERLQREFDKEHGQGQGHGQDSGKAGAKATAPATGATRVKSTRLPESTGGSGSGNGSGSGTGSGSNSSSGSTRPVSHLAPGITNSN